MEAKFWQQRWHEGRIGFHQEQVTPLLEQYWSAVGAISGDGVFVPLAGKSRDMSWLAARGHRVLGVELSGIAVAQFFAEHELAPTKQKIPSGILHSADGIDLVHGDVFALGADLLSGCCAVYDRAALIALPPPMRERYAREVYSRLPSGCRGLLVTLEYPQHEKQGPPFSVSADEVEALFRRDWELEVLERRDILASQPGFVAEGVTALHTVAWRLQRR
jgi:thiopurine S-methyltransferase